MDQIPGQYIIMPAQRDGASAAVKFKQSNGKRDRIADVLESATPEGGDIHVIRSPHRDDEALVELTDEQRRAVVEANPEFELLPVYRYTLATVDLSSTLASSAPAGNPASAGTSTFRFRALDSTGTPVSGAKVSVWQNGGSAPLIVSTDAQGEAMLTSSFDVVACVVVSPLSDFWDSYRFGVAAADGVAEFVLEKIDPTFNDCFKFHYGPSCGTCPTRVTVAVVDTGVDDHPDLKNVRQRTNWTNSEPQTAVYDNGTGHGTHVAGLIGASGALKGVAQNVDIFSYRAFEQGRSDTGSFFLVNAIDAAVNDGADIINLSLGQKTADKSLGKAVERAIDEGVLVVCAAGNDGSNVVQFPAVMDSVVSVGAIGREGTFPAGTTFAKCPKRANGSDALDFVPRFSNSGKIDLAAPGVAIVSTVGSNGYVAKNGTSMAAPIVSGIAARILASDPSLAGLDRGPERLGRLKGLLYKQCNSLGFGVHDVGSGLPHL